MIWHSMETAPHDGTAILARYHNDVSWEYRVVWWGPITPNDPYPWRCEYNSYPEERCSEWTELEPESDTIYKLRASLKEMIETQDERERAIEKIIGRAPGVFNRAIDRAKKVLEETE